MESTGRLVPEQARKLLELVEQTGLIEALRADLYARWKTTRDPAKWAEIAVAHELLDRAENELRAMTDG